MVKNTALLFTTLALVSITPLSFAISPGAGQAQIQNNMQQMQKNEQQMQQMQQKKQQIENQKMIRQERDQSLEIIDEE